MSNAAQEALGTQAVNGQTGRSSEDTLVNHDNHNTASTDRAGGASTRTIHKAPADMTPEERLESMRAFAEEKKYIYPGQDGTMATQTGYSGGTGAIAFGGSIDQPLPYIAPPHHNSQAETVQQEELAQSQNGGGRRRSSFMDKGKDMLDKLRGHNKGDH